MAATAHLLVGFIGSGKTTFSRELEEQTSATRYCNDEWMIRQHGRNPPEEFYADYFEAIENQIWTDAEHQLRQGRDLIIDSGFWSRQSRDIARNRLDKIGAVAKFYFVTCPRPVMLARTLKRTESHSPGSLWIDKPAFEKLIRRFEPMQADEDFVTVDGTA